MNYMHVTVTPSIHSTHYFQSNLDGRVGRKEYFKCFVVLDAVEMSACDLTEWKFQAPSFTLVQQARIPSQERVITSLWSWQKTERKVFFQFPVHQEDWRRIPNLCLLNVCIAHSPHSDMKEAIGAGSVRHPVHGYRLKKCLLSQVGSTHTQVFSLFCLPKFSLRIQLVTTYLFSGTFLLFQSVWT